MSREQTALGQELEEIRRRKRFSVEALARASSLSGTYVTAIEDGYDRRTGKEIRPSVDVLRRLADALGDGAMADADRFYRRLMGAAGYLQGIVAEAAERYDSGPSLDVALRAIRESDELSDRMKTYLAGLIEETRRITRGEPGSDE